MAPVLMMFHTFFVLLTISGWQIKWTTQNRADMGLTFTHCLKLYGWLSCLGLITYPVAAYYLGTLSFWLLPILAGWILRPDSGLGDERTRVSGLLFKSWRAFCHAGGNPTAAGTSGPRRRCRGTATPRRLWVQALAQPVRPGGPSLARAAGIVQHAETPTQSFAAALGER